MFLNLLTKPLRVSRITCKTIDSFVVHPVSIYLSSPRNVYPVKSQNTTTTQLTSEQLYIGERETRESEREREREREKIDHERKGQRSITNDAKRRCG
jgi:hypothetical protein